jgi:hypothetical protein
MKKFMVMLMVAFMLVAANVCFASTDGRILMLNKRLLIYLSAVNLMQPLSLIWLRKCSRISVKNNIRICLVASTKN